jgi:hypothetical protein
MQARNLNIDIPMTPPNHIQANSIPYSKAVSEKQPEDVRTRVCEAIRNFMLYPTESEKFKEELIKCDFEIS